MTYINIQKEENLHLHKQMNGCLLTELVTKSVGENKFANGPQAILFTILLKQNWQGINTVGTANCIFMPLV